MEDPQALLRLGKAWLFALLRALNRCLATEFGKDSTVMAIAKVRSFLT